MKINNTKATTTAMYGYFFIILLDFIYLVLAVKTLTISSVTLYGSFLIILIWGVWSITALRSFSLEVTEHLISIKYKHPFSQNRHPVLEVPLQKVVSVKTEKGIVSYIMVVSINSKRGIKNFYYGIGQLPENQFDRFRTITELVS